MIYGIGTDIVEIKRIAAARARFGERFVQRILGVEERARYLQRLARSEPRGLAYLATRFAAKEAVAKALGLGLRAPMTWRAVEVVNAPSGRPIVLTHGALAQFVAQKNLTLHVSVSDEREVATAYAIAESL